MTEAEKNVAETEIITNEKTIVEFEESIFGQEGKLMEMRKTHLEPIQKRIKDVLDAYALHNKYDLIIDIANNPTILYYSPASDKTEAVIKLINK